MYVIFLSIRNRFQRLNMMTAYINIFSEIHMDNFLKYNVFYITDKTKKDICFEFWKIRKVFF